MAHGHLLTGRKSAKNPPHSVARVSLPAVVDGSGTTGGLGHGAALLLPRPSATPASTSPLAPAQGGGGGAADAAAVGGGGLSGCRRRSLWIGGLINWMDEDYLRSCFTRSPELFIGSLDPSVTDEDLMEAFGAYGELVNVKVITGKQVGFVKYSSRASAEEAIKMLNGSQLAGHAIRVQWDRWNGGLHGQPQCSGPDPDWCSQDPNKQNYTTDPGYGYDQQGRHVVALFLLQLCKQLCGMTQVPPQISTE
uniref:RRM domain-containing protein n=1 Tax=Leersia perrieri TaxID=77586 RepID=A0A0D9WUJ5_9ORYZ